MNEREMPVITGNGEHALIPLKDYIEAVRAGDIALQQERDRRYAEVNVEKEKALKIKETADLAALQLAREIQTYKDEKANELREQISNERGLYATREDLASLTRELTLAIKPLTEFVAGRTASTNDRRLDTAGILQFIALIIVAVGVIYGLIHH